MSPQWTTCLILMTPILMMLLAKFLGVISLFACHYCLTLGKRHGQDTDGGTQRLPRLVGRSKAKELIFTGRKINGRDAMSIGLVNFCVSAGGAHQKALEIARDINQKGPLALKLAKRAIDEGLETDFPSALSLEEECYEELLDTKDRLEGLAAFAEKRRPVYTGK